MMKRVVFASVAAVALTSSAAMAQCGPSSGSCSIANWGSVGDNAPSAASGTNVNAGGVAFSAGVLSGHGEAAGVGGSYNAMGGGGSGGVSVGGITPTGPAIHTYNTAGVQGYSDTFGGAFQAGNNGGPTGWLPVESPASVSAFGFGEGYHTGTSFGNGSAGMVATGTTFYVPTNPNVDGSIFQPPPQAAPPANDGEGDGG